jgi:hypothetical protein
VKILNCANANFGQHFANYLLKRIRVMDNWRYISRPGALRSVPPKDPTVIFVDEADKASQRDAAVAYLSIGGNGNRWGVFAGGHQIIQRVLKA